MRAVFMRIQFWYILAFAIVLSPSSSLALLGNDIGRHNVEVRRRHNPYFTSAKAAAKYEEVREEIGDQLAVGEDDKVEHEEIIAPEVVRKRIKRDATETTTLSDLEQALALEGIANNATNCSIEFNCGDQGPSREKIGALVIGLSAAILVVLLAIVVINCFTLKIYLSEQQERKAAQMASSKSVENASARAGGGHSPQHRSLHGSSTFHTSYEKSSGSSELPFEVSIDPRSFLLRSRRHQGVSRNTLPKGRDHRCPFCSVHSVASEPGSVEHVECCGNDYLKDSDAMRKTSSTRANVENVERGTQTSPLAEDNFEEVDLNHADSVR
ncbi:unnamed protein product [Toxocara canis]|uniref:Transmembrane protein n=1 Tax=Toxocara canis TaxID=6265 RepID=A0A183TYL3_TOXCA|nr:unnamed protein product [Toxocara canis]